VVTCFCEKNKVYVQRNSLIHFKENIIIYNQTNTGNKIHFKTIYDVVLKNYFSNVQMRSNLIFSKETWKYKLYQLSTGLFKIRVKKLSLKVISMLSSF